MAEMEKLMVFVFLLDFLGLARSGGGQCPAGFWKYSAATDKCFWTEARDCSYREVEGRCRMKFSGSRPAMPKSKAELDFIANEVLKGHAYHNAWVGMKHDRGIWKWEDGTSVSSSYRGWKSGEPKQICNAAILNSGKLRSVDCSRTGHPICEVTGLQKGNCLSKGRTYFDASHKCYWYGNSYYTYTTVESACRKNNPRARLAMPKSKAELNLIVKQILSKEGHYSCDSYIGLQYTGGIWKWKDGTGLRYIAWNHGEPRQICNATILYNGQLRSAECTERGYPVCELKRPGATLSTSPTGPDIDPLTDLRLTCHIISPRPNTTYKFYRDGELIRNSTKPAETLTSVSFIHSGNYTCEAKLANGLLSQRSTQQTINIRDAPTMPTNPSGPDVDAFRDLRLTCLMMSTRPNTTYKFYHDGELIRNSTKPVETLTSVTFIHSGDYTCEAKLVNGLLSPMSSPKTINVREQPSVSSFPPERTLSPGKPVEFYCSLRTTRPGMKYTFYHEGKKLQSGSSRAMTLPTPEFENSGAYTCEVEYKGRRSPRSERRVIMVAGCPVPEADDEYMARILSSITPREETTRWGTRKKKKKQTGDTVVADHDEL